MFKEILTDVLPIIEKVAPVLANTLSGPYAILASHVVSMLIKAFEIENNDIHALAKSITDDPESHIKLLQVQSNIPIYLGMLVDFFKNAKIEVVIRFN